MLFHIYRAVKPPRPNFRTLSSPPQRPRPLSGHSPPPHGPAPASCPWTGLSAQPTRGPHGAPRGAAFASLGLGPRCCEGFAPPRGRVTFSVCRPPCARPRPTDGAFRLGADLSPALGQRAVPWSTEGQRVPRDTDRPQQRAAQARPGEDACPAWHRGPVPCSLPAACRSAHPQPCNNVLVVQKGRLRPARVTR